MHEHETINAPGRQDTLLTGPSRIHEGRYKSRKGWPWSGALVEAKITYLVWPGVVVESLSAHPRSPNYGVPKRQWWHTSLAERIHIDPK